jgi:hypothetical protein
MNVYLIQRGKFSERNWKEGVDGTIDFDYMGSAEFEFGALPKSLKNIRENLDNYSLTDQSVSAYGKKTKYRLFAPEDKVVDIVKSIELIALDKVRLKEQAYFDAMCGNKSFYKPNIDFWWDIENYYMWWLPNELETQFMQRLKQKQ